MMEYGLYNKATKQRTTVFGRSLETAILRAGLDIKDWEVLYNEYVD